MRRMINSLSIAAIFTAAFVVAGCVNQEEQNARDAVTLAFTRASTGDIAEAMEVLSSSNPLTLQYNALSSEESRDAWLASLGSRTREQLKDADIHVPAVSIRGAKAIANVEVTIDGTERTGTVRLSREKGLWKLDSLPYIDLKEQEVPE